MDRILERGWVRWQQELPAELSRLRVMKLQAALSAITNGMVPEAMQQRLAQMGDKSADSLMQALEVRKGEQSISLQQEQKKRLRISPPF